MKKKLKDEYASAWRAFREYSGENEVLMRLLHYHLQTAHAAHCLIDIGCGDAALTTRMISEGVLAETPGLVLLLEPTPALHKHAVRNVRATLYPRRIPYEVIPAPLRSFNPPASCYQSSIIYSVHTSYYFDAGDLKKIANLRSAGSVITVVENDLDSWVSQVMYEVGNTEHPQFDHARYLNLLDAMGLEETDVQHQCFPANLDPPSVSQTKKMIDFFSTGWEDRPAREELYTRLQNAFADVLSQNPRFAYRVLVTDDLN